MQEASSSLTRNIDQQCNRHKGRAVRASRGECGNISLALPVIQNAAPPITTLLKKFKKASPLVGITLHHLISEVQLSKIAEESWMLVFIV
nr:hypothetical protein [Klebsiella pneumoniae subsp. pneumoniae]